MNDVVVFAVSFGTDKEVNLSILLRAINVAFKGFPLFADHYLHKLGLVQEFSDDLEILGKLISTNQYVSTTTVCKTFTKAFQERGMKEVILIAAPQHEGRVVWILKKLGVQNIDTSHGFQNLMKWDDFYSSKSDHIQTRSPLLWWLYEIIVRSIYWLKWQFSGKLLGD